MRASATLARGYSCIYIQVSKGQWPAALLPVRALANERSLSVWHRHRSQNGIPFFPVFTVEPAVDVLKQCPWYQNS
jgi:hypothetical protein